MADKSEKIQDLVRASLEAAIAFFEENLEPDMVKATEYYRGEPFGDEEEGRSQVVSMDVHDVTQGQLPSLLKMFFGGENAVSFRPDGPQDVALAELMTEYVNYVIREDNPGFLEFHAAFKDALIRRLGVFKWWHEDMSRVKETTHDNLTEQDQMLMLDDPDVEDIEVLSKYPGPDGGFRYSTRVRRIEKQGRERFMAVPPEEFVFTEDARTLESAPLVAHVREVPREDIVALGVDEDLIDEALSMEAERGLVNEGMKSARLWHDDGHAVERSKETLDDSQRPILFAEAYVLVDADGDGTAECRLFQCIGKSFTIVNGDGLGEIVDEVPFAVLTMDPEPHTIVGRSNYDDARDVQRIKSQILRGTLNSLAAAIEPRVAVRDGEVVMGDLVNPEINGIIRTYGDPNQVIRDFTHQFIGHATLPMLEYQDQVRESRSGWNRSSAGLDPEALQSSTRTGVAAHLTASQQRIEMTAITFAETGIKRLYQGLLGLAVRHGTARSVQINGRFVDVDPRSWNVAKTVRVNLGIGQGTIEQRMLALSEAYKTATELMQGGCPFVTWAEIRHILGEIVRLSGRRDADLIFKPWSMEDEQRRQEQAAQNPPPPDPAVALVEVEKERVQVEQMKAQAMAQAEQMKAQAMAQAEQIKAQLEAQKLQLEQLKAQLLDDRERDKIARDTALKRYELEMKYATEIDRELLRSEVELERAQLDADLGGGA